jgi:cell wall-associated NlpC family hydrolase
MDPRRLPPSIVAFAALVALAGCAGAPQHPPAPPVEPAVPVAAESTGTAPMLPAASPVADAVISRARGLLGTPYRFGGADPAAGFDCSGLVHFVYAEAGIRLPRTAESQQGAAARIERELLAPGDLVFFRLPEPHVGIYAGGGEFIHAPGRGRGVEVARLQDPWFVLAFAGAGRVLEAAPSLLEGASLR